MTTIDTSKAYQELVEAIVKAVPEIMALKVGITFLDRNNGSPYIVRVIDDDGIVLQSTISERKKTIYRAGCYGDYQNKGRPITLEDVLRTYRTVHGIISKMLLVNDGGWFALGFGPQKKKVQWHLGNSLEWHRDNAPETISFLHSLLV